MTRLPSASTYHQRVWYHARTEQAEKCIRWSFDGFVLQPNFSQSLGAHQSPTTNNTDTSVLIVILIIWHWCPDYNTDTGGLITILTLVSLLQYWYWHRCPDCRPTFSWWWEISVASLPRLSAVLTSLRSYSLCARAPSTGALVQSTRFHGIVGKPM